MSETEAETSPEAADDDHYKGHDDEKSHVAELLANNPGPLGRPEPSELDETDNDEENSDG